MDEWLWVLISLQRNQLILPICPLSSLSGLEQVCQVIGKHTSSCRFCSHYPGTEVWTYHLPTRQTSLKRITDDLARTRVVSSCEDKPRQPMVRRCMHIFLIKGPTGRPNQTTPTVFELFRFRSWVHQSTKRLVIVRIEKMSTKQSASLTGMACSSRHYEGKYCGHFRFLESGPTNAPLTPYALLIGV